VWRAGECSAGDGPRRHRAGGLGADAPAGAARTHGVLLLLALLWPMNATAQAPSGVEYYHLDALGSVRAVTDANGQVVRRHDYKPFGEEVTVTFPNPDRQLFTGQERDPETGLDYFGARYYRPKTGRFTTVDPVYTWEDNLVDPQRWNRYAYARGNPLSFVDPDGRIWVWAYGLSQASMSFIAKAIALAIVNPEARARYRLTYRRSQAGP